MTPEISVVIPVYNEAGNVAPLIDQLVPVIRGLAPEFEILVVNDVSTDTTAEEIAAVALRVPQCRELRLPLHAGQATALLTGLRAAQGSLIVTLDGDGQNDPSDIPALHAMVMSGAVDLACGWRYERHDTTLRKVMSRIAYAARRIVLNDRIHDAGCQLRVFRREVCRAFFPFELMQSFIPAMAVAAGFKVGERKVTHHARKRGESKYGFGRLWWRPAVAMLRLRWNLWRRRGAQRVEESA